MARIRTHYLDASALVKILIQENGSVVVRDYFDKHSNFFTTSLCFAETLGVLKTKYLRKDITQQKYLDACYKLMEYIVDDSIVIDEINIANSAIYSEVENLVSKYDLDISDAFQIVTLKKGFFSRMEGETKPILITGDSKLADAVRHEGLRVWNCMTDAA